LMVAPLVAPLVAAMAASTTVPQVASSREVLAAQVASQVAANVAAFVASKTADSMRSAANAAMPGSNRCNRLLYRPDRRQPNLTLRLPLGDTLHHDEARGAPALGIGMDPAMTPSLIPLRSGQSD